MAQGILTGVRVIDLCDGVAGSVAAMQLGEAGAEVIKVEAPAGAAARGTPGFSVWNRGKKSVVIDLEAAEGRADLERLLASADVLIHGFKAGEARDLGLDDQGLADRCPGLIVSAVTGWPQNHPDAERASDESLVLARLGILSEQPGHRPGPIFIRMPYATFCAAWFCAIGVVARLLQRGRGLGAAPVHTSLAQGALAPMTMHWARAQRPSASFAKGLDKTVAVAIHRCADGQWIHVHYSPDAAPLMKQALDALGPDGVAAANGRWGRNHTAPNFGANREIFATRPAPEWLEHLWAHDVAAQPAAPFGAIHFDAQARACGYVAAIDDPAFGATLQPGPPYRSDPAPRVGAGLRPLGADTGAVLASAAPRPPGDPPGPPDRLPLEGVKLLDFGAYLAGPFGAMLLADLGADVVKVEPTTGDFMRYLDRAFCGCQRGKRSVALQLKDPRSRPALEALVRWADGFHHNMRLPSAHRLGLGYEDLKAINPDIVGCHVSSYGPDGERADWPGYDQMFQASCGWEVEDGGEGNPPMWLRFGVCDHFGGLASAFALLLALFHRDRTGQGQMTAASLLGATLLTTGETLAHPDGRLEPYPRLDHDQTGVSDTHRLYQASDGWVAVAALTPGAAAQFQRLIQGDADSYFGARTARAAEADLQGAGVPAERVREDQLDAFLDDPANLAAGLVAHGEHATQGRLEQVGAFWTLGDRAMVLTQAAPALGQHSRAVLSAAGLSETQLDALAADGVMAG